MFNAGKDVEQRELLFIAGEAWPSHFGKQFESYLHANKCLSCNWAITFLGIYPDKLKLYIHTKALSMIVYGGFIHSYPNLEAT